MSENKKFDSQFTRLLQLGIIVRDVEKSVRLFEDVYGFGPWKIDIIGNEVPVFKDMKVNGEKKDFKIKAAMCSCFGMEIELIEPVSDSPYKQWLDEHGPGLHHLAFETKDEYQQIMADHKKATGKEPWVRGECEAIGMDFSYLDFREELGIIAEIYGEKHSDKPGHDF